MRRIMAGVCLMGLAALCFGAKEPPAVDAARAVKRGVDWLASVQGADGGWGQDGGGTTTVRQGERLETQSNDVANTAVAVMALVRDGSGVDRGPYGKHVRRGVEFILRHVEQAPREGLAVTSVSGTQIQRKLGPFIDTFLTSRLFADLDGHIADNTLAKRVQAAFGKTLDKIQANQLKDGSWNFSGGWAPILGTSMASQSLDRASAKGFRVDRQVLARVDNYTREARKSEGGAAGGGVVGGVAGGVPRGRTGSVAASASPVALYEGAQQLEQMSRTESDRKKNAKEISELKSKLGDASYVRGFGSMGGEEFFSYLNVSDSLKRAGGAEWEKWNSNIKSTLVNLQNNDGTWAGHQCITGRVAVTGAAILTLAAERPER